MAEGGLRDRLIFESIFQNLEDHLDGLGWFDTGRYHLPITLIDEFPEENDEEVEINTIAISMGDAAGIDREIGSKLEEHEISMFFDFFAENDSLGRHVIGDIYEFFRTNDVQQIYDYSADPNAPGYPPELFTVEILDPDKRKPDRATSKFMKHWFVCSISVVDERDHLGA